MVDSNCVRRRYHHLNPHFCLTVVTGESGTNGLGFSCTACPTGYYCQNAQTQTACAAGSYNAFSAATSASACLACPQVMFALNAWLMCYWQGKYSSSASSSCTSCGNGCNVCASLSSCSSCLPGWAGTSTCTRELCICALAPLLVNIVWC